MKGQAFTLEGVMASLLLLVVMYTFFHSSLVVSPTWSELSDAQLRLLAQDTLKILDNPSKVYDKYLDDSLQGMVCGLDENFKANTEFVEKIQRLVFPASIRLELYWVENDTINSTVILPFNKTPTPEAVSGSRYIILNKDELSSAFKGKNICDPVVFEVRLILWRP